MGFWRNQLSGPTDPASDAAWDRHEARKGFFTDTSICIGCKACEVACKEWNGMPEDGLDLLNQSYDNTGALGASTWRHVAFVEQDTERIEQARASGRRLVQLGMPSVRIGDEPALPGGGGTATATLTAPATYAPALRPALGRPTRPCPTCAGSWPPTSASTARTLPASTCAPPAPSSAPSSARSWSRTTSATGAATAWPRAPSGSSSADAATRATRRVASPTASASRVRRAVSGHANPQSHAASNGEVKNVGIAQKCTLCYDRLGAGQTPACAQACPTTSIKFGDLTEMRATARARVAELHDLGFTEARLYGTDENDGVGGTGSVFLLLDEPEVYGLPPDPRVTTADLPDMFRKAGLAGLAMLGMAAAAFVGRRR